MCVAVNTLLLGIAKVEIRRGPFAFSVTGNLPQLNDPTMISVGTKVMVMLLLQYSQQ